MAPSGAPWSCHSSPRATCAGSSPGVTWHSHRDATRDIGGTSDSLSRLRLADASAFVNTWYGPANATLVITGKVDPAAAMAVAERYFGSLPPREPPARPALPALPPLTPTLLTVGASVTRTELILTWVTPPLDTPGDLELDLAAAILADGESIGAGFARMRLAFYAGIGGTFDAAKVMPALDTCFAHDSPMSRLLEYGFVRVR